MTQDKLQAIVRSKRELANIPVIANADFGHTYPQFTFPIGGVARLDASRDGGVRLEVVEH